MNARIQFIFNVFFMCHRLPERSFFYKGKQFPICARCTGLALGYILSFVVLILAGLLPLWAILLLIIPTAIDGTGQLFGKWHSNNSRRFVTGTFAGIGVFFILFHIGAHAYHLGQSVALKWFQ